MPTRSQVWTWIAGFGLVVPSLAWPRIEPSAKSWS